jgi:preprotein translocase subunit SecA
LLTPTSQFRITDLRVPAELPKGLDTRLHSLVGKYSRRGSLLKQLETEAEQIDTLSGEFDPLTDQALRDRLHEFRDHFRRYRVPETDTLHRAVAAVREAAHRTLGLRPFVVQLTGALALHRGYLAEMATGEGKTLVAGVAAVLEGWTALPCHIVTVNDYLAERDSRLLRPLYEWSGLTVGVVVSTSSPKERVAAYDADITYATSKELLADFLRDRLRLGQWQNASRRHLRLMMMPRSKVRPDGVVMRGLHTAIVDEADSVLIDEAVTPLIISKLRENTPLREACKQAHDLAQDLKVGVDYRINREYKEIELDDNLGDKLEEKRGELPGMWKGRDRCLELIKQALVAREFFLPDKQYVIQEGKVVIVDEFTGRLMPQRTWRQGLHQAIEAKEGLKISDASETLSRLSFQRFFRFFHKLSGMTGTAAEAASELWYIYDLPTLAIPTNRLCIREQLPDRIFLHEDDKWKAIVDEIIVRHHAGQPVLIGTRSVRNSERLAEMLEARAVTFELLNATRHAEEARIIAEAGRLERITIATNMAGRGTDIMLGAGVTDVGGLHVIATERHESGRIDRQLFGRAARQGDPGSSQAFISMDDELIQRFSRAVIRRGVVAAMEREAPISKKLAQRAIRMAQNRAQRLTYKQRQGVLRMDTWLEDSLSFAGNAEVDI